MSSKALWETFARPRMSLKHNTSHILPPRYLTPCLARSMATETDFSADQIQSQMETFFPKPDESSVYDPDAQVVTTVHSFPELEPLAFNYHPIKHLNLPLRRDILHRAVIYEGDATRKGLASSKWRDEIRGSSRKIRPQKGTGSARLGNKKSPMLRGGGKAFGPKPRDFSTDLPKKIYDLAWRTALSYRYRRGQLIVLEDGIDIEEPSVGLLKHIFKMHGWDRACGGAMVVTSDRRENLFEVLEDEGAIGQGEAKVRDEVDVKDLLSLGRLVIEQGALENLLQTHSSDLEQKIARA